MMVTAASDMDSNVYSILATLQSKTASHEERTEAYLQFSNNMKDEDVSLFNLDVSKHATQILTVIEKDIAGDNVEISQGALQVLGFVLHDSEIARNLSSDESTSILSGLCQCVLKTEDKTVCTRALWCLSKQSLSPDVIMKNLHSLGGCLEHALVKWKAQSVTVENEAFNVIARLMEKCPKEMKQQVLWWAKLLLPLLVHNAIKVRERVLEFVQLELSTLITIQVELAKFLETDFNKKFGEELKRLFATKNEIHVMKCWSILVQLFGETLHQGSNLINVLLPIVELGFKSSSPDVKCVTFQAWQQLIDNFAINPSILTDPRRVKLIMQVFKINNAKTEGIAMVKLQVWWHFIWLLGSKVSALFDQVCVPLIQFCMGGNRLGIQNSVTTPRGLKNRTSPITPQLNLSSVAASGTQFPVIPALQQKCCEILAHFLGNFPSDLDVETPHYSLDPLSHDVITAPGVFIKHANLFITTTTDLICSLGKDIPEKLLHQIWYSLVAHMKNALENLKSEMREILSTFLTQFQIIILSQALPHKSVLRMFEAVCCLPRKSLCSTAYNISNGEKIHGTPALFLTELLLTPVLLKSCSMMSGYMVLVSKLVECGMGNTSGAMEYCQATLKMLSQNVEFVCGPETVWRLWSSIVNPLHEQIRNTNEVNQGDALEHDFSCLYSVLMFPVQQKLPANMPQPSVKTLLKTWCEVYTTFARLTALVANAEANVCCEDLCHKLLKAVTKEDMQDLLFLDFMVHICLVIVNCVDFLSLGSPTSFNLNALSPAKWTKRKQKPMDNIHSLVTIVCLLLDCVTMETTGEPQKKTSGTLSLQSPANNIVDLLTSLFTHVHASNVISSMIGQLSKPISELYHKSSLKTTAKIYNNAFMQKLEKLWQDICACIQKRLKEPVDSELLSKLSPLLESTFLHSRRNIKHQTAIFWKSHFSQASSLTYPESLVPVLYKLKEKNPLPLPGWTQTTDVPVIEETPVSQMSQSQAPEPHIPGMPSPRRIHGSFLNKAISPNIKKSPAKPETCPEAEGAKRNILSIYDFKNNDFVVIKSPPRKKRALTEHQKEVLKEKKAIPAMYNNLDVSQDVSLMASQFSSDTQTQPEAPLTSADSVIVIGSQKSEEGSQLTQPPSAVLPSCPVNMESISECASQVPDRMETRKRSVRFKDSEKKDTTNRGSTKSPTDLSSKSIGHFSVIKELSQSNSLITISSDSQKEADSESLVSGGSGGPVSLDDGIPQNVLGAMSAYDNLSSKSLSLESKKSETNSKESFPSSVPKDDSQNDLKNNQPLLSFSNQLKTLSQTQSTRTCEESKRSSQSLRSSQSPPSLALPGSSQTRSSDSSPRSSQTKSSESPPRSSQTRSSQSPPRSSQTRSSLSPLRSSRSPRRKSSLERKADDEVGQKKLDGWIMKSPNENTVDSCVNKNNGDLSGQSEIVYSTIVEETQSPKKNNAGKSSPVGLPEVVVPTIMETPPRQSSSPDDNNSRGSSKKLFTAGVESSNVLESEDSNIIPSSPCNVKKSTKLGTPVLKIKRLTNEEIKQFTPKQKEKQISGSSKELEKTNSANRNLTDSLVHEHDDFSEIRPLDAEDVSSSQGFVPIVPAVPTKSQDKAGDCVDSEQVGKRKVTVSDQSTVKESKAGFSENLFTEDMSDDDLYNPMINDTFNDMADVVPGRLCNQQNLQSTQVSEESSVMEVDNDVLITPSPEEYDPKQVNTLNSEADVEPSRRGRKRKQATPKKLSPDSVKPKRRRKNKTPETEESGNKMFDNCEGSQTLDEGNKKSEAESPLLKLISNKSPIREASSTQHDDIAICNSEDSMQTPKTRGRFRQKATVNKTPTASCRKLRDKKKSLEKDVEQDVTVVQVHKSFSEQTEVRKDLDENSDLNKKEEQQMEQMTNILDKITDQVEITGQKTPETRTLQTLPKRKSTTKKKIEVAHKWSQNKEKCIVVNSGVSNLDSDSSDEDTPLIKSVKKLESSKECHEKPKEKIESSKGDVPAPQGQGKDYISDDDLPLLKEAERIEDEAALKGNNSSLTDREKSSDLSEDDFPLSNLRERLCANQEDKVQMCDLANQASKPGDSTKGENSFEDSTKLDNNLRPSVEVKTSGSKNDNIPDNASQEVVDLTSSQSNKGKKAAKKNVTSVKSSLRLRSSQLFLRTGKPVQRISHLEKTNRSLKLEKTKMKQSHNRKQNKSEENSSSEDKKENEKKNDNKVDEPDGEIMATIVSADGKSKEVEEHRTLGIPEKDTSTVDKEISRSSESQEDLQNGAIDETPRKVPDEDMIVPSAFSLFERHSDSKLVTVSRKFAKKRPVIARRSILKPTSVMQNRNLQSPSNKKNFHPIKVGHIYSPSASPSAGILKRRRLSGDQATNSPSPPSKQRRVSFSEPLTFEKNPEVTNPSADNIRMEATRPQSPLVTDATAKVSSSLEKFFTTPAGSSESCIDSSLESRRDTQMTQNSFKSTQESQLSSTQPVYPELMECPVNVERVLPQLTSSMWMRGLGQLVRARKIHTVGDLSSLTEREVDNLPIRSPKVSTVRSVLRKFENQEVAKKTKSARNEGTDNTGQSQDAADSQLSSSVTNMMTSSSQVLNKVNEMISRDKNENVASVEEMQSSDNKLKSDDCLQVGQSSDSTVDNEELTTTLVMESGKKTLLQNVKDISSQQVHDLKDLKMEEIFEIQQHLSSLSNTVMAALKARCNPLDESKS